MTAEELDRALVLLRANRDRDTGLSMGSDLDVAAWFINYGEETLALARRALIAESAKAEAQPAGTGWVQAHALPSWLTGLFWIQFDDRTVARKPATRNNGAWWYDGKDREHAPVIAYCPAVPPPAPEPRE